ncbi:MAG: asparagine synthase (glutamine-hydrolyzing) [Pseudomonadota bacterium]
MCGIAGIINKDKNQPVDRILLHSMCDIMAHRGPDGEGFWEEQGVGFGHRRLSIIDLATGQQPMSNEDGTIWITYNGEVYNYLELKKDLELKGHIFKTTCDTETIIHLYEEYGHRCVEYLNGMFAFAIADTNLKEVFIARDRLGIKPIYFYENTNKVVFSSEIKSILQDNEIPREMDFDALGSFFSLGYVPAPKTAFKKIQKLLPGHYLVFKGGQLSAPKQYWDLKFDEDFSINEKTAIATTEELLTDSINIRLRSDVPLGVMLSGGLDSSTVLALLSDRLGKAPQTFSIGYEAGKSEFSELEFAKRVAQLFHSKHHFIEVSGNVFADFLPKFAWHFDEPVLEAPAVSLFLVSKLARENVKVVLSGEGSDEIFAGYGIYNKMLFLEKFHHWMGFAHKGILELGDMLNMFPKISRYLRLLSMPLEKRFWGQRRFFWLDQIKKYFTDEFKGVLSDEYLSETINKYYQNVKGKSILNQMLYIDTKTWLPEDILPKSDKMSMANSLELRVPFLDYRLVEKAATFPSSLKNKDRQSKYILKKMVSPILPNDIIHRKKMGFPVPLKILFQNQLHDFLKDMLLGNASINRGVFNKNQISRIIDEHHKGVHDHSILLFSFVVLELWSQTFLDQSPGPISI